MPFYEYGCETCEHEFEELISMSAPNPPCPKCAGEVKRKITSTFAVGKASPKAPAASPCGGCPGAGAPGCPRPQ